MLHSLLPKAHRKFSSLPLLGPIIDGFDDWLAASGYTPGSREFAIRMLPHVDADLRRRRARHVASLTPAMLHACWVLSSKRSRPTQEQCGHWQDISRPPE